MKDNKIKIWEKYFSIVKSRRNNVKAFANINDGKEITWIIDKNRINKDDVIEINNNWKAITFDTIMPLESVGFLVKVSKFLADDDISIFVISGYSTDHILVKKNNLNKAIKSLEKLGFTQ